MMIPPGSTNRFPSPPPRSRVRLVVRLNGISEQTFRLTGGEFLIGGASGCNLRLPGTNLPPLICQIGSGPEGIYLRQLVEQFPIFHNGEPIPSLQSVILQHGDRLAIGAADITIDMAEVQPLRPSFVPFPPTPSPSAPAPALSSAPPPGDNSVQQIAAEWRNLKPWQNQLVHEREELNQQRAQLAQDHAQLAAEQQHRLARSTDQQAGSPARPSALQLDAADLKQREAELAQRQQELESLRQQLHAQYSQRRDELTRHYEQLQAAAAAFESRKAEIEAQLAQRAAALEADYLERCRRHDDEIRTLEPRLAELRSGQERLAAAFAELDRQRQADATARAKLLQDQQQLEADRAVLESRRSQDEKTLRSREQELNLREQQLQHDRVRLAEERERHAADLLRLDRWQAVLDDRKHYLDHLAAEIELRASQLRRDTAELEEQVSLADAEQQRLQSEQERLERTRIELEQRQARIAERTTQLDAQQASLAMLKARLDRQQDDLRQQAARIAADRTRLEDARQELDTRLREAERLRAELDFVRDDHAKKEQAIAEQKTLLETTLHELHLQQATLTAEQQRLQKKEQELDDRAVEIAEHAATLKARLQQTLELQERLEFDRKVLREREATLCEADSARAAFQEQLRRRAEELAARSAELDQAAGQLAEERATLQRLRAEWQAEQSQAEQQIATRREELDRRTEELHHHSELLANREAALARNIDRLRQTGRALADQRKQLARDRQHLREEQAHTIAEAQHAREQLVQLRQQILAELESLQQRQSMLEHNSQAILERLTTTRDFLRAQLAELHDYAAATRNELETARLTLRDDSEALRQREQALDRVRDEHRLAVAQFRQQLLDWQTRIAELKEAMARSESRIDAEHAEVAEARQRLDATTQELARQAEELRQERQRVFERRAEIERHLAEMREWYRKKLRELAEQKTSRSTTPTGLHPAMSDTPPESSPEPLLRLVTAAEELDPGDRQLGELLLSHEFIDEDTLRQLWAEANRQHRTLRQILLASGVITLYQLAMIEAGTIDALMLGRLRVIDRLRVTPKETVYRVFDPLHSDGPSHGQCILRLLSEAEAEDAAHPDEFRQRFAAAAQIHHPNLLATLEVLEYSGRPAVLQEWLSAVPGSEWPAAVAIPGVWLKLLTDAARALCAIHDAGLIHGRLIADSFLLTPDGTVKLSGFADPPWLLAGPNPDTDMTPARDLRSLGQIATGWSLLTPTPASLKKRGSRAKVFPEQLTVVLRRLEADADTPMADTAPGAEPYQSAHEFLQDCQRLATVFPCRPSDWAELLNALNAEDGIASRRSA